MRKLKKTFLFLVVLFLLGAAYLIYFLFSREAPITQGEVDHHLEYKTGLDLDLYQPTQDLYEQRPVLVHFHGGAWIGGEKIAVNNDRFHGAFNGLREKGYVIISPNYTLAEKNKSPFPACIEDAIDVMRWVEEHAEEYKLNLKQVGLMGESAGAHLALMAGLARDAGFTRTYTYPIQYLVDVYGPTDLNALYNESEIRKELEASLASWPEAIQEGLDISSYLFGFDPASDSTKTYDFAMKHSPISYLGGNKIPLLMIHGDVDRVVPYEQSLILQSHVDSLKWKYELHKLEGSDHAFRGATEAQKDSVQQWILEFVETHSNLAHPE